MKIAEIIDKLCSHEISKQEAIEQISVITDGMRKNSALGFTVDSISFGPETDRGYLKIMFPSYEKIKHIQVGDKVDVMLIP